MAVCRLGGLKSELVEDQAVTKLPQKSNKPKLKAKPPKQRKTQQHKTKQPNRGMTSASSWAN
jgi:hypothetical protein